MRPARFAFRAGALAGSARSGGCRMCFTAAAVPKEPAEEEVETVVPQKQLSHMHPRETVQELNKYIIGQHEAKKAVAIALRNRWRRHRVPEDLKEEITPKNILMVGPTGVGKTEVARRLAKLTDAPFVKVEATKFSETGFIGRDVDSIIDDLLKNAVLVTRQRLRREHEAVAKSRAEDRVLEALAGKDEKDSFRHHLRQGGLDEMEISIDLQDKPAAGPRMQEGMSLSDLNHYSLSKPPRQVRRKLTIKEALPLVEKEELAKLVDAAGLEKEALRACEEDGVVVIDEIDKIVSPKGKVSPHASVEGVQSELLPLIEGSVVSTRSGQQVKTDRILFICSGAFHSCSPSDMMAELQGRLPIRVHLKPLTEADFYRILTEPEVSLLKQSVALMGTEGIELDFSDGAVKEIAKIASDVNSSVQNIGARRLITVMERVMDDVSFKGPELRGKSVSIDQEYVQSQVQELKNKVDLQKYLL
eukprot:Hpha_TRINITY_DN6566_c0_g1::TRINITY_DN6566_c0_g1_i1::g.45900::m.45900/K03667/hslU; ATP-dependent HslUV protease ATP-binding subunit HslU